MALQSTDIGLVLASDVGDVAGLQTNSKQIVPAINEILSGSGNQALNQLYIQGENNVIEGNDNIVYGNNNQIIGSGNVVVGDNLIIIGSKKIIMNSNNFYADSVDIANHRINFYFSEGEIPISVGDKVALSIYCNYSNQDWSAYSSWDSGRYITEITNINTEYNYLTVADLRLPSSPPVGYPYLDMVYISTFVPLSDLYKINGNGGVTMGSSATGANATTVNYGNAEGSVAFAANGGNAKGYFSFACNGGYAENYQTFAANYGKAYREKASAFGDGQAYGGRSVAFNIGYTAGRAIKCIGFSSVEKSVTAANTEDVSYLEGNYVLIRWKNNSNTIIHSCAKVLSVSGQKIYVDCDLGWGGYGEALMPDGYIFRAEDYYSANAVFGWSMAGYNYSQASGLYAIAAHEGTVICGKYGVSPEAYAWALANGTSFNSMGLAAKILQNGNMFIDGTYSSPCADYAELFEWSDGNPNNEDRVGYFVTLDGGKIKKSGLFEPFVLGVVSGNPAILGDSAELHWNGKYMTDDFGRVLYHDVTVHAVTEEREVLGEDGKTEKKTVVMQEEHIESQAVLNPEYDATSEYIPRLKRKEWSAVGVLGKLIVYDDCTCEVGGLCQPNEDGKATKAINNGYKVLKRVAEDKIMIWFKG